MNIYESEEVDWEMDKITDLMGDFILDVIMMSLQKINHESPIFKEFLETRLEMKQEDEF